MKTYDDMEINITRFFSEAAPMDYSASVAELGSNAGPDTWRAACDDSEDYMLLDTDDKRDSFRAFVRSSGGWNDEEIAAWTDTELNALFIQWIAGDMRESDMHAGMTADDWTAVEKMQSDGVVSSNIFRGTDGEIYFYAGA